MFVPIQHIIIILCENVTYTSIMHIKITYKVFLFHSQSNEHWQLVD